MTDFATMSRTGLLATEALGGAPPAERLAALRAEPLLLAIDPAHAATRRGQLMLVTAASLLGRLFEFAPAIDVAAPPTSALAGVAGLTPGHPLGAGLVAFLTRLAPGPGTFRYREAPAGETYARALVIGAGSPPARHVVHVDGNGWWAAVGPGPVPVGLPVAGAFNPFGPLAAAALGAAEIAKHVFRQLAAPGTDARFPLLARPVTWDLWQHGFDGPGDGPALPGALELGRFALAGLGALGSAAVWALAHLEDARGTAELIDDDRLAVTNLERVLTATGADVGALKVRVAARLLADTRLRAVPLAGRYGVGPPPGARATTILAGLDSGAGRRRLQALLPRALYNGGTQGSEFLVSRHVGLEGPCLECLYPEVDDPVGRIATRLGVDRATATALRAGTRTVDDDILAAMRRRGGVHLPGVDAEGLVGQPLSTLEAYTCSRAVVIEDLPEATISFVSALAGILMACELVKDRVAGSRRRGPLDTRHPVFRLDALAGIPGPDCLETYIPRRDCVCQQPATRERFAAARTA